MKNKKGFTLVEILVVIVIMGILAAVAVPKLFGSIAKAKFSEVPPAAATYIKLQDVYLMAHSKIGNWSSVGYAAPGTDGRTKYFFYGEVDLTAATTNVSDLGEDGKIGWKAFNLKPLHNCMAGSEWTVTIKPTDETHVEYVSEVNSEACIGLASAWGNVNANKASKTELSPTDVGYTMTMGATRPGGWSTHSNSFNDGVAGSQLSTYNEKSADGLFQLEPNSVYEYTIEVPAELWNETKGQFLQTVTRVYSDYDNKNADGKKNENTVSIVCGSTTNKQENDPNQSGYVDNSNGGIGGANGYSTGSTAAKNAGYTADASMKTVTKEDGSKVVVTTVTITTGNAGGGFGANFLSSGVSYNDKTKEAATAAIKTSTITKTGNSDGTKTATQIAKEKQEATGK